MPLMLGLALIETSSHHTQVLHIVPSARRRGCELFAYELLSGFAELGISQAACVVQSDAPELDFKGTHWSYQSLAGSRIKKVIGLRAYLKRIKPRCVYVHGGDSLKLLLPALIGFRHRPRIVVRKIGITSGWISSSRSPRWLIYRWLYRQADRVLVLGDTMYREAMKDLRCRLEKVIKVPNYRRFEPFSNSRRWISHRKRKTNALTLLAIGALEPEKNVATMIELLYELRRKISGVRLVLVGDGSERANLERLVQQLGVSDIVSFLGTQPSVENALLEADIFLLCSLTEGVPGVLIEAGFASLPTVAWEVGDIRAVVDESTAVIAPFGDRSALFDAVYTLAHDQELRRVLGTKARERCKEQFAKKAVISAHLSAIGLPEYATCDSEVIQNT